MHHQEDKTHNSSQCHFTLPLSQCFLNILQTMSKAWSLIGLAIKYYIPIIQMNRIMF